MCNPALEFFLLCYLFIVCDGVIGSLLLTDCDVLKCPLRYPHSLLKGRGQLVAVVLVISNAAKRHLDRPSHFCKAQCRG